MLLNHLNHSPVIGVEDSLSDMSNGELGITLCRRAGSQSVSRPILSSRSPRRVERSSLGYLLN
jgi:hypothetical protein